MNWRRLGLVAWYTVLVLYALGAISVALWGAFHGVLAWSPGGPLPPVGQ